MKLLIATPIFDQSIPIQYFNSFWRSVPVMLENGINFDVMTETRNLISVSRNKCAHRALEGGYDKLLFIDSDMVWEPDFIVKLARSKREIVGGTYPFRTMSPRLNLQSMECHGESWVLQDFISKYADENGEVEVQKLPTGFLMIDVSVFRKLMPIVESYKWKDPMKAEADVEKMFFPIGIEDGYCETEDWGFCRIVKEIGYKIYWNTSVITDHMGIHQYTVKHNSGGVHA